MIFKISYNKEKYGSEGRENTKIKYIINKMKKVQNYYSDI